VAAGRQLSRPHRIPVLAVDEYLTVWRQGHDDVRHLAGDPLGAGQRHLAVYPQHSGQQEDDDDGDHQRRRQNDLEPDAQRRDLRVDEHERADHEANEAGHGQQAVTGHLDLRDEEADGEHDEHDTDVVDGQDGEGEQRQEDGDAAENTGEDRPRMRELEVDADDPRKQQQIRDVRVGDRREQLVSLARPHLYDLWSIEHELLLPAVETLDDPTVEGLEQLVPVVDHQIDELVLESLAIRVRGRLADRFLGPLHPAPSLTCERAGERRSVVGRLLGDRLPELLSVPAHRVGRSGVGAGRHGGHICGDEEEKPSAGRVRSGGCHINDHRP